MLKIGLISDIHHAGIIASGSTKISTEALSILQGFKNFCDRKNPDLVVNMGDNIDNSGNHDIDLSYQAAVIEGFSSFAQPVEHIPGNHDDETTSLSELATLVGSSVSSRSLDLNGFHLVLFCADVKYLGVDFAMSTADLSWLESDLASTTLPAIVFSHISLDVGSLIGNHYFSGAPGLGGYTNAAAARSIISDSTAVLCMNGHVHWNEVNTLDSVPYVTIQSAVESSNTGGKAARAYGMLTADEKYISIEINGYDPVSYKFPCRAPNFVWT